MTTALSPRERLAASLFITAYSERAALPVLNLLSWHEPHDKHKQPQARPKAPKRPQEAPQQTPRLTACVWRGLDCTTPGIHRPRKKCTNKSTQ